MPISFAIILLCIIAIIVQCPPGKENKPIDKSICQLAPWDSVITDDLGWLTEDIGKKGVEKVKNGMEYFYDKTNIQPELIITDQFGTNPSGSSIQTALDTYYADKYDGQLPTTEVAGLHQSFS